MLFAKLPKNLEKKLQRTINPLNSNLFAVSLPKHIGRRKNGKLFFSQRNLLCLTFVCAKSLTTQHDHSSSYSFYALSTRRTTGNVYVVCKNLITQIDSLFLKRYRQSWMGLIRYGFRVQSIIVCPSHLLQIY